MEISPGLKPLISGKEIAAAIKRMAEEIERDYRDKNPVLVGVLKGSFMFLADIIRCLDIPLEVDFMRCSSYGSGTESSGKVTLEHELSINIQGRHVLVVEDIVDTGLTTGILMDHLREKSPASLRLCSLLDKPSRRKVPVTIDYLGFTVPDRFLVGYGIDWNEKYRNLPDIYYLEGK